MNRLLYLCLVFGITSCNFFGEQIHGNGNIKSENRSVENFTGVEVGGSIDLYLTQGSAYSLRIETDENLMEHIEIRRDGSILEIRPRDHANLQPTSKVKVYVSAPAFRYIGASGASDIYSQSKLVSNEPMDLHASGASNITLELNAPRVETDLSGASSIHATGETKDFVVDGSGASTVRGYGLLAENVDVEMSGASNAEVSASVSLNAGLSGASHVKYKGNASVNSNTSGASGVSKAQ